MRSYFPLVFRMALFGFVLLASASVVYTTAQNAGMARSLAELALEGTALSLSTAAEKELRANAGKPGAQFRLLFSDRVVAYAFIAQKDGKILFHTNPELVGSVLDEQGLGKWLETGRPSGRRITLKTGLPAFESNYPLHRPDGQVELLRLVLNTAPADRILAGTERMWWTIVLTLAVLWGAAILLERMFSRQLRLADQLEKNEKMALIGQMTAVLAHEIRNALGGIKGYSQWVAEKMDPADPKKEGLSFVLKGVDRIESLVHDLLLYSREETYRMAPLNLQTLVREVISQESPLREGRVDQDVDSHTQVLADREKMARVLSNGLQNAVQATGGSGLVWVRSQEDGGWVEIRIEDNGPGIDSEALSRLFTPFFTTKTEGTGLGLAYSKKVVEGMGGSISLFNLPDRRGACLAIRLPRAEGN